MDLTVENVCGLLIRSKLLAPDDVRTTYQRWQGEAKSASGNVEHFAKWLVARQYVTDYQANLILRGLADNFFLNQYKILDRLGQGCMAGVYKAVHSLGQVVAIKVLPPSKAKNTYSLARFQREARLALRLKHVNVVRAFQVGEANGLNYMVMEYLEGETLKEVLQRRGRLPPSEAVRLVYQALLGLQHFYGLGMVHRDLKPSNLMLVPGPPAPGQQDTTLGQTVKIFDVGLARALFEPDAPESADNPQLTGEGVLLGTPDYMAPEQARDAHGADIRADIYSLGCVLYHALAGQPPFPDTNLINQMIRHAKETPRPATEINPEVPDGLQQILNWMMAKDPNQRYPTPERAAQALQVFLAAGAESVGRPEEAPQLHSYLTWLERDGGVPGDEGTAPVPSPEAKPAPAAAAVAAAAVPGERVQRPTAGKSGVGLQKQPGAPVKSSEHKHRSRRHRDRAHAAAAAGPAPPQARETSEPVEFDVELVPIPATEKFLTLPYKDINLSRRDVILLGIGAGVLLVVELLVLGLTSLFRRKKKEPVPEPAPTDTEETDKESS